MQDLITVEHNQMVTTSLLFAEEFKLNHMHLLEKIRKLTIETSIVKKHFIESTFTNKRGRTYPMFKMTRDGFMFLVMNTNAKGEESRRLVFEKQLLFIQAFNLMEQKLAQQTNVEWITARKRGKIARREETDAIKLYIEYAIKQGSKTYGKTPELAYSNFTRTTYKALNFMEHKKPKTREMLDGFELSELMLAERLINQVVLSEMKKGTYYKEIYQIMKKKLEDFYASIKITKQLEGL